MCRTGEVEKSGFRFKGNPIIYVYVRGSRRNNGRNQGAFACGVDHLSVDAAVKISDRSVVPMWRSIHKFGLGARGDVVGAREIVFIDLTEVDG